MSLSCSLSCFLVSSKLRSIADVIIQIGGSGQNADPGSNWQGIRGASGGLALLAMDHSYEPAMLNDAVNRVVNYINNNQKGASPRGWNPEGSGYTAYPLGSFVGPFALALRQSGHDVDLTANSRLQWMFWSLFAGATTALDIYGMGGVKTDWSDDNGHIGGEGSYGLAFAMAPEGTLGGIRHAYDRLMGDLSPLGARWDSTRHGTFWSILFYPEDVAPQNPAEIWSWHQAGRDTAGLGMMTFRDGYEDANDSLVQFKARLNTLSAHDGADGLGFRVIAQGAPFVLGGGRDNPARDRSQPTVYPANPDTTAVNSNSNQGSFVGTPLIKPDGGGHAIAWMSTNNVGTNNHKRWIITDFDKAATGADVTLVVADTSSNGTHWQLPTFLGNTLTTSGNTFTITGGNGATLRGTILHPGGSPVITVGVRDRGSAYSLLNGGTLATEDPVTNPRILQNRYLHIAGADGNFLVVMTIQRNGAHPSVARLSGGVADALIQVGNRQYQLQSDNVLYDGAAFSPPAVTVTFDHGALGTHSDGTLVQTMAYGAMPVAPGISVTDPDYVFLGWDKPVGPAVVDTVYTAVYGSAGDPAAPVFTVDPVSMAVVEGSSVALSVVASGNPAPTFQWYKNGAMIPGATDAILAINYAVLSDAGTYFATAGNSEGTATSASAVLTVNEAPANQSPTANSQVVLMESGQAVAIQLTATDPENDPLTFHIVEDPYHGVITGTAPNLTYTPNTGFSGIDVFTFRVHDGISFSNTAYVEIEVTEGVGGGSLLGAAYVINGGALDQSTTGPNGLAFNRASGYQGALFNLTETISLQSVGDYIELHLTVAEFVSSNNNPWSFRFGLFDHAGVPATADNQTTVTNEWVGYLAWFRTSTTGTSVVNNGLFRQASGSAGLAGTPNQGGGFGSNPSGIGGGIARLGSEFTGTFRTEDTSFQAMLRLERTEDGLHVTTIRHSHTGEEISRTDLAAHVPTWDFNAIAFAHDGNFTLVDIEVMSFGEAGDEPPPNPLPEPIRINFERAASATPSGFLKDAGQVFGDRGNGYSYGWSGDRTGSSRERNSANSPGGEFDTLNHMQMGGDFSWEIEVPNGEYSVRVVAGDPDHLDSTHRIAVQGVLTVDGQPSAGERWIEGTQTIVVTNGRIALSNAPGANNNKICFVEITALTSEPPTVAVTGVTLDLVSLSLETGATEQLTATVSPSDATDDTVTWSSSNPSVATVSSSGLVTAVGAGSATITVTTEDGGMTASASVDVFMPVLRVSFETATTATTPGFLKDAGHPFGNRDNGYAYGWSGDRTTTSRERNSSASASKAFDTLNHMQMGGAFHWEIALLDGTYSVRVVAGDAEFPDSTIRIAVQGLLTVSGQLSASQRWVEGTQIVEVTHGILTVSNATEASNNKISFIEITPVPPAAQSSLALDEGGIDEPFMARLSAERGGHSLSFPTTQGRSYWLEASTDLRNWSEIGGPWEGDGDEWVMDLPITSERRFFRIRSED
ncbi:MAG: Ig-like domain-containing protein [Opitutales bacterium]|nr:Ig-like domain-containing protein [Opitutales bacterium]